MEQNKQNLTDKKRPKKTQEQIWNERLQSTDIEEVKETIQEIRDYGTIKMVPILIENYSRQANPIIRKELEKLLSDIKLKEAAKILFQYVLDDKYSHIKKDLLSILWQSRLDFSQYIDELVEIFIKEPFDLAFEAFTVIEYMEQPIDSEVAQRNIEKLKAAILEVGEQKKFLLIDLVNILKKWV